ncbi:MAG: helix-turn-helix domain-containing protein [bacterium]|nr:helix-turn-helix domain-containing protein [bacterium]
MRKQYKKLTYADRKKIEQLAKENATPKQLAQETNVHISTIYRELERGGDPYNADAAQRALFG